MKRCSKCKRKKSLVEFYKRSTASDGLRSWCKLCCGEDNKSREYKYKEYRKRYHQNHKKECYGRSRKSQLYRRYKLTVKEYNQMAVNQKGVCIVCKRENINGNKLSVDHNHKTGIIRGLLCSKCNHALGLFDENIKILKSMIKYLRKYI